MKDEIFYGIALSLLKGIGDINAKQLISYAGSAQQLFKMPASRLQKINGIGPKLATVFSDTSEALKRAEQELAFIEKNGIEVLFYYDKRYPSRLLHTPDAPLYLFCKGNFDFNKERVVSIVGTRHATEQGRATTEQLVADLSACGVSLVSGLAFGIDICAHKAAQKYHMQNIAVLAHGLDRLYPSQHRAIAEKLQQNGALVSDYLSGTNPDRQNFPNRNRIVAGMTDATIVIESAVAGGALITAEIANAYNRDVFAFPGRINDEYSQGCLKLIKQHKAQLVTCANDIIQSMNWDDVKKEPVQAQLFPELSGQEQQVYAILKEKGSTHIDILCATMACSQGSMSTILLQMEMKGCIISLPGKRYQLVL